MFAVWFVLVCFCGLLCCRGMFCFCVLFEGVSLCLFGVAIIVFGRVVLVCFGCFLFGCLFRGCRFGCRSGLVGAPFVPRFAYCGYLVGI